MSGFKYRQSVTVDVRSKQRVWLQSSNPVAVPVVKYHCSFEQTIISQSPRKRI